jgi:hypothetical protein
MFGVTHAAAAAMSRLRSIVAPEARLAVANASPALFPLCTWLVLEVRLDDDSAPVDLSIGLRSEDRARIPRSTPLDGIPAGAFVRRWASPRSALHALPFIWLEYDAPFTDLLPAVFAGLSGGMNDPRPSREQIHAVVAELLETAGASDAALAHRVTDAVDAIGHGQALHIGVMPARSLHVARIVALIPPREWNFWLDAIGWPGNSAVRERALAFHPSWLSMMQVHVDVGDTASPRLGIEFYSSTSPAETPLWSRYLRGLVDAGACTAGHAEAALRWQGEETERWGCGCTILTTRRLFLKTVVEEESPPRTKGYFGLQASGCTCRPT